MKDDQRKSGRSGWKFRFPWLFETSTEYESKDDSEALKMSGQNPLKEEESVEEDDTGGD